MSPFEPCRRTATGTNELVGAAGTSVDDAPAAPVVVAPVVVAPVVEDAAELVEELTTVDEAPALVDEVAGPDDELEPGALEVPAANVVDVSCPNASEGNSDDTRIKPPAVAAIRRRRRIRRIRPPRPISVDIVIRSFSLWANGNRGSTALQIRSSTPSILADGASATRDLSQVTCAVAE